MVGDRIRSLREHSAISQSELARRLGITRASVNAWEMGISAPTAQYLIAMAQLFHVSTDYILGISSQEAIIIDSYSDEEKKLLYDLTAIFDKHTES